jgi:hypothetical protein
VSTHDASPTGSLYDNCNEACEARYDCTVCGQRKAPVGRDLGDRSFGYCDDDCPGYYRDPYAGHLFPGELARIREEGMAGYVRHRPHRCTECQSTNIDCIGQGERHWHVCFDCGHDGPATEPFKETT